MDSRFADTFDSRRGVAGGGLVAGNAVPSLGKPEFAEASGVNRGGKNADGTDGEAFGKKEADDSGKAAESESGCKFVFNNRV